MGDIWDNWCAMIPFFSFHVLSLVTSFMLKRISLALQNSSPVNYPYHMFELIFAFSIIQIKYYQYQHINRYLLAFY